MKTRHLLLPFLLLLPMLTACPKELINTGQGKDPAAILTGEVSYSEGVALPEGSTLTVVLEDMSETDTAGTVIAEKKQEVKGAPPYTFELEYPVQKIQKGHGYSLRAGIEVLGKLRFASAERIDPFTEPSGRIRIMLRGVAGKRSAMRLAFSSETSDSSEKLDNIYWRLTSIGGKNVEKAEDPGYISGDLLKVKAKDLCRSRDPVCFSDFYYILQGFVVYIP